MIECMKFHHIGIACHNIKATAEQYAQMGYKASEVTEDPIQNIRICFLTHEEMPMIELLEPVDENSPVVDILSKNGTTPYHICYTVPDMDEAVRQLRKQRYLIVSKAKPATAIPGHCVAFLYHKDVGLIELCSESK